MSAPKLKAPRGTFDVLGDDARARSAIEASARSILGSAGYERIDPVMPHRPVVPIGAPGELRLDAKTSDVIPEYPY